MEVLPSVSLSEFLTALGSILAENVPIIIAVIGLFVGITFIIRWFHKGTRTFTDYDGDGNLREYKSRVKW